MGALCLVLSTPPTCSCGTGAGAGAAPPGKLALAATSFSSAPRLQLAGRPRRRAGVALVGGGGGEGEGGKSGAAAFFGEDGVVDDMDGYLNYLSLEYDSVWDTKPAWCQPWTILLSGTVAVAFSWVLIQSIVITAGVSFLICAWCAYTEMIAERRRKVASGAEDTYGMEKIQ
ncbi:hypothetical protein ACP70R_025248 [Stipagrostis hirtigluma subsp. patula]